MAMSRTVTIPEIPGLRDIWEVLTVAVVFALVLGWPLLVGIGLWLWLAPHGFYQMVAMLLAEVFVVGFLYVVDLLIIAVIQ